MAKQYYHNLCDITIETIKKKGMKEKDYQKRFKLKNFELLNKLHKENKSVIGSIGHCANFEWVLSYMPLLSPYDTYVTYQPLNNKFFDDYMLKSRSVFGLKLYHHKKTYEVLDKNKDICTLTVIGGDQAPPKNRSYYWTTFLNQDTSFYIGIEKIAKLYNLAVVFFDVYKIKRGHYQIEVKLITDDPIKTKEYEIIEAYKNKLEDSIKIHPADWLWSHRRWKYKKEDYINT